MLIIVVLLVALNVFQATLAYRERVKLLNAIVAKNSSDFQRLEAKITTTKPERPQLDPNEMAYGL